MDYCSWRHLLLSQQLWPPKPFSPPISRHPCRTVKSQIRSIELHVLPITFNTHLSPFDDIFSDVLCPSDVLVPLTNWSLQNFPVTPSCCLIHLCLEWAWGRELKKVLWRHILPTWFAKDPSWIQSGRKKKIPNILFWHKVLCSSILTYWRWMLSVLWEWYLLLEPCPPETGVQPPGRHLAQWSPPHSHPGRCLLRSTGYRRRLMCQMTPEGLVYRMLTYRVRRWFPQGMWQIMWVEWETIRDESNWFSFFLHKERKSGVLKWLLPHHHPNCSNYVPDLVLTLTIMNIEPHDSSVSWLSGSSSSSLFTDGETEARRG